MQRNVNRERDFEPRLSRKQEQAIIALLSNPTTKEAAAAVGVSETTLWRWLQNKDFRAAYIQRRRETVSLAIARLQQGTGDAVSVLNEIMLDKGAAITARVGAARTVIEYAIKAVEFEDLAMRVADLERSIQAQKELASAKLSIQRRT
jgi:predicted DNA-binding protein (UPF0251 family)